MKKITALVLVLVIMASLGILAFAEGYPDDVKEAIKVIEDYIAKQKGKKPVPVNVGYVNSFSWETDVFQEKILLTSREVKIVPAKDVEDKLNRNELAEFLNAYEAARATSKAGIGKNLRAAYWYSVPERLYSHGDNYTKFAFTCTGRGVEATLNGEPLEIVHYTEGTSYYAKIPHNGILMIYSYPD